MQNNNLPPTKNARWISLLILIVVILITIFTALSDELEEEPVSPTLIETTIAPTLPAKATAQPAAHFDFYVLALSWSPNYCATDGKNDAQECGIGRKLGFVLHGLWPEYNKGYPSDCSTQKLPADVRQNYPGLYPNQSLYDHEWEKHGTCSGLQPDQYLALSKNLKDSVNIPDRYRAPDKPFRVSVQDLKTDFTAANPELNGNVLAVFCSGSGRFLSELQVCFSIDGKPAACSADVQKNAAKSCQNAELLVQNVR